jgi:L-lactate dehydrogenase (cytochrome)
MSPRNRRRLNRMLELEDFEITAAPMLPSSTQAYVRNGAESGAALRNNHERFNDWRFIPRVLRGVGARDQSTTLFGRRYAAPFAVAPMGAASVISFDADNRLARAARTANIPYALSANSITPMEELIRFNPDAWFAAYLPDDTRIIEAMVDRVGRAGFPLLMVTVDVPVPSNRPAERRAGYSMPLRPKPRLIWDTLTHPRWLGGTFARTLAKRGLPVIANILPTGGPHLFSTALARVTGSATFDWSHIDLIRRRWPGHLVIKGLLDPEDAHLAAEHGADGIVVSNHGGRQLDFSVASIEMLAAIKARSGSMTVLIDSGFRRGTDILKALALGADAVMIGRPFLYAATLAGQEGGARAIEILKRELDIDMGLLGINSPHEITADMLLDARPTRDRRTNQ